MGQEVNKDKLDFLAIDKLTTNSVVLSIGKVLKDNIIVDDSLRFFLAKSGFFNIEVYRGYELVTTSAEKLLNGDILVDLGQLRWPLNITSDHQIDYFKKMGLTGVYVEPMEKLPRIDQRDPGSRFYPDDFYTVPASSLHRETKFSRLNKKAAIILSELHQIQDSLPDAEKTREKGFELMQDLYAESKDSLPNFKAIEVYSLKIINSADEFYKASHLLMTLRDHDEYTHRHSIDVANQLLFILRCMSSYTHEELQKIALGGLLHDIGKSKIPAEIITKNGKLDDAEWKIMRMHPIYSGEIMRALHFDKLQVDMGQYHHLRKDGSGYPSDGDYYQLSEVVRILMIVDVYQSLVTLRPYRKALPSYVALTKIQSWSGKLFDSWLVDIFIKAYGLFPIGSFVRLNDFRYGFVLTNDKNTLRPTIAVCFNKNKVRLAKIEILDLSLEELNMLEISAVVDHREFFRKNEALDFFMSLDL